MYIKLPIVIQDHQHFYEPFFTHHPIDTENIYKLGGGKQGALLVRSYYLRMNLKQDSN